jgi:cell fate (sporulation/competence/biofilm development) regulator YlbF (YheA/YmcA/DUF963 family)
MKAARQFADALKESELYQAYRKSRVQLERYPDIVEKLKRFKQIHSKSEAEAELSFDQEKNVSHRYAELTRHPAAAAFLERERVLLETYKNMIDLLDDAWEIDLFE